MILTVCIKFHGKGNILFKKMIGQIYFWVRSDLQVYKLYLNFYFFLLIREFFTPALADDFFLQES